MSDQNKDDVLFVKVKGEEKAHMVRTEIGGPTLCTNLTLEPKHMDGFEELNPRDLKPLDVCADCWVAWFRREVEKAEEVEAC